MAKTMQANEAKARQMLNGVAAQSVSLEEHEKIILSLK